MPKQNTPPCKKCSKKCNCNKKKSRKKASKGGSKDCNCKRSKCVCKNSIKKNFIHRKT